MSREVFLCLIDWLIELFFPSFHRSIDRLIDWLIDWKRDIVPFVNREEKQLLGFTTEQSVTMDVLNRRYLTIREAGDAEEVSWIIRWLTSVCTVRDVKIDFLLCVQYSSSKHPVSVFGLQVVPDWTRARTSLHSLQSMRPMKSGVGGRWNSCWHRKKDSSSTFFKGYFFPSGSRTYFFVAWLSKQ